MFKIVRIVLSVLVVALSGYMLIADTYELLPYSQFLLGILMAVLGAAEFKKGEKAHKWYGITSIGVAIYLFYVAIQTYIINN